MDDNTSPAAVLNSISEIRQELVDLVSESRTGADFAFQWAKDNGGVPATEAAEDKLLADLHTRFELPTVAPEMADIDKRYKQWARKRRIKTTTQEDLQRFDDDTGVLTAAADKASGFATYHELIRDISARLTMLAKTALAFDCDDSVVAAMNGAASLLVDVADGRAGLADPTTHTDARLQANQIFTSEGINGIPLHRALEIALEKIELAAKRRQEPDTNNSKHSDDFATVTWCGIGYRFTKTQAECVKHLWAEWKKGQGLGLSEQTVAEKIGFEADRFRLTKIFRTNNKPHPAMGTMIHSIQKGVFALLKPDSP